MKPATRYRHTVNVHNTEAASEMVPLLIAMFNPRSVVDIGCGLGSWLAVFEKEGISDIMGIDGDYVERGNLYIKANHFLAADLEKPLPVSRKFDLAISLEVAEHLKGSSAAQFVQSLVNLSDRIIFSAAIPGQGGQNHLNEQWPSWWAEIFKKHGYDFYDVFRDRFWDNRNVEWWYRQNIFLVTKPALAESDGYTPAVLSKVHPDLYLNKLKKIHEFENGEVSVGTAFSVFAKSMLRAIKKRLTI